MAKDERDRPSDPWASDKAYTGDMLRHLRSTTRLSYEQARRVADHLGLDPERYASAVARGNLSTYLGVEGYDPSRTGVPDVTVEIFQKRAQNMRITNEDGSSSASILPARFAAHVFDSEVNYVLTPRAETMPGLGDELVGGELDRIHQRPAARGSRSLRRGSIVAAVASPVVALVDTVIAGVQSGVPDYLTNLPVAVTLTAVEVGGLVGIALTGRRNTEVSATSRRRTAAIGEAYRQCTGRRRQA